MTEIISEEEKRKYLAASIILMSIGLFGIILGLYLSPFGINYCGIVVVYSYYSTISLFSGLLIFFIGYKLFQTYLLLKKRLYSRVIKINPLI
ncbi:MAG: hypothetical protein PVH12_03620 [Candidatus Bathyarchaeota archaeon]